ncbi:MAG: hypothetical protein KF690_03145 [Bacteroidetes bacterium]|nr:hypothetical protein [Bacteroidota bacterium]
MRRRCIALSLAVVYAALMGYGFLPYILFKVNQEYIAQNLCVNRDVPGSECQGTCHLKKILDAQDEQQKDGRAVPAVQFEQAPVHTEAEALAVQGIYPPVMYVGFIAVYQGNTSRVDHKLSTPPPEIS